MVVDALILDREQLDQAPVAASILVNGRLSSLDNLVKIFTITLVAQVGTDHELLAILGSVLDSERYNVTAHAVDAHDLVVLHLGEFIGNLLFSLATRVVLGAGERVVCDADGKTALILCLNRRSCG